MKLKDIADMKDYLETRCYCPYEIYDTSGFSMNSSTRIRNAHFLLVVLWVKFTEHL